MLDSHDHAHDTDVLHWRTRLEHCPSCRRDLVQPLGYEPLWGDRWLIVLDCPNCQWHYEGVVPHAALRRFEDYLDRIDDLLWDDLLEAEQERMQADISAFAEALATNAILPEDF